MLVYDITSRDSFKNCAKWVRDASARSPTGRLEGARRGAGGPPWLASAADADADAVAAGGPRCRRRPCGEQG